MRKVLFFMMTSLDGYFEGPDHDISWHNVNDEFNDFALAQLKEVDTLLFGRVTYELMAGYWPTEAARNDDPVVAERMNSLPKIVFSRTLSELHWENTTLVKDGFAAEVMKLKQQPGKDLIIFGSTTLVKDGFAAEVMKLKQQPGKDLIIFGSSDLAVSFLEHGLLDECRIMISPVVLGRGKALFAGINDRLRLRLLRAKTFHSGNVLLYYEPLKK
jgi:dihydrofolate reductase